MSPRDASRIHLGIFCLAASGFLTAVGLPLRGPVLLPGADPAGWMAVALLPTHDLAFWGVVLSIAGNGLFLPSTGILAFADPAIAHLVQAGIPQAVAVSSSAIDSGIGGAMLAASGIELLAGSLLVSLLLWRSPKLPRWTAIPYLLHAFALTVLVPLSYLVERAGGVLLLVVTIAIAQSVWRQTRPDEIVADRVTL